MKQPCALCERSVESVTLHHLVPKSYGGRAVVALCRPCHQTLHSFFSNRTLSRELNSIAALRAQPEIAAYLRWIVRQPDAVVQVRPRKDRR